MVFGKGKEIKALQAQIANRDHRIMDLTSLLDSVGGGEILLVQQAIASIKAKHDDFLRHANQERNDILNDLAKHRAHAQQELQQIQIQREKEKSRGTLNGSSRSSRRKRKPETLRGLRNSQRRPVKQSSRSSPSIKAAIT